MSENQSLSIRDATDSDIPFLEGQAERIVHTPFTWANYLSEENESFCLIAEIDGAKVGHLLLSPAPTEAHISDGSGHFTGTRKITWWKLRSLGVEPHTRRQGVAETLLATARNRVPSSAPGVYGNIDFIKTPDAALWYRAKGFRIAVDGMLRDLAGPGSGPSLLHGLPENMYFFAEMNRLAHFANTPPTARDELRLAQREMDSVISLEKRSLSADYAYRALGTALLERVTSRCVHLEERFGPQIGQLIAWDPELMLVCRHCGEERLALLATNTGSDLKDFCDGCQRRARDVVMGRAVVELNFISAALCGECRRNPDFTALPTSSI